MVDKAVLDDTEDVDWGLFGDIYEAAEPLLKAGGLTVLEVIEAELSGHGFMGEDFGSVHEDLSVYLPFLAARFEQTIDFRAVALRSAKRGFREEMSANQRQEEVDHIEAIASNLRRLADELDQVALEGKPK